MELNFGEKEEKGSGAIVLKRRWMWERTCAKWWCVIGTTNKSSKALQHWWMNSQTVHPAARESESVPGPVLRPVAGTQIERGNPSPQTSLKIKTLYTLDCGDQSLRHRFFSPVRTYWQIPTVLQVRTPDWESSIPLHLFPFLYQL